MPAVPRAQARSNRANGSSTGRALASASIVRTSSCGVSMSAIFQTEEREASTAALKGSTEGERFFDKKHA
jgi:hypothetical protein